MIFSHKGIKTLSHPKRYIYQIDKLIDNIRVKGMEYLFLENQNGINAFSFNFDKENLAKNIANDIRKERYIFSPARQKIITTKNKNRIVYHFSLTDKIVIGVISQILNEMLDKIMHKSSYAFRINMSPLKVLHNLSKYIKKISSYESYIFRTDFVDYSNQIPLYKHSVLWKNLIEFFHKFDVEPTEYQWYLIKNAIRPEFYDTNDNLQSNIIGAPTGSSIIAFINNFYVYKMDDIIGNKNIFYSRYCDDILLCHYDAKYLQEVSYEMLNLIDRFSLSINDKKNFWGYFTPSAKKCVDSKFIGINNYNYLGYCIHAKGDFSISKQRQRKFLRIVYKRIKSVHNSLYSFSSIEQKAKLLCQAVNNCLTKKILFSQSALTVIFESTNHSELKNLDYQIALRIAEKLSNVYGAKAFRYFSYATLRNKFGLQSLVQLRNYYK